MSDSALEFCEFCGHETGSSLSEQLKGDKKDVYSSVYILSLIYIYVVA